ncbi:hypothetical protein MKW98_028472, partial [Papaver atlanticum]
FLFLLFFFYWSIFFTGHSRSSKEAYVEDSYDAVEGATIYLCLLFDIHLFSFFYHLYGGVRNQLSEFISGLGVQDLAPMSGYIQAIGLLDDLDKELDTYATRFREWYRWHFRELAKIVSDNILYAKAVKVVGNHTNAAYLYFSKYRAQLYDYLKTRMNTIALNLTTLVGELVGSHLISHGGILLNLAKHPRSTIQILGEEKTLFRAFKTKHATPIYGLIYHASLIGQAAAKLKEKKSRTLEAKSMLAIRCDDMGDGQDNSIGLENRAKAKRETYHKDQKNGTGDLLTSAQTYNPSADSVLGIPAPLEDSDVKKKNK